MVGASVDSGLESILAKPLRATTFGILVLITLIAFEEMAVSPALPTMARDLHGIGSYGWAFTGFLVASVVGMVVSGQVCDRRGPRLPLAVGMVAFLGGLVVAGTAASMMQLVAGRVVQGASGGLLMTAAYVVIGETYPESSRPRVFAAISSAWVLPSLLGPVLSGVVTQHVGWRWVFLGLLPFGVVGSALMVPVLFSPRASRQGQRGARVRAPLRNRLPRALAVAAGIAALEGAGQRPSPVMISVAAAGLVTLVWGLRGLLPPGTVRVHPGVSAPIALRGLLAGSFFGVEAMVPLSLSIEHHFNATEAGLPLACSGVAWAFGSWLQGRDSPVDEEVRRIRLARAGFVLIAIGAIGVALCVATPAGRLIYPAWALAGAGAGMTMSTLSVLLLKFTNDRDRGTDSASLQLADVTSGAVTTGLAGVLVAAASRGSLGYGTAFVILDVAMACVALVGVFAASRLRALSTAEEVPFPELNGREGHCSGKSSPCSSGGRGPK